MIRVFLKLLKAQTVAISYNFKYLFRHTWGISLKYNYSPYRQEQNITNSPTFALESVIRIKAQCKPSIYISCIMSELEFLVESQIKLPRKCFKQCIRSISTSIWFIWSFIDMIRKLSSVQGHLFAKWSWNMVICWPYGLLMNRISLIIVDFLLIN